MRVEFILSICAYILVSNVYVIFNQVNVQTLFYNDQIVHFMLYSPLNSYFINIHWILDFKYTISHFNTCTH